MMNRFIYPDQGVKVARPVSPNGDVAFCGVPVVGMAKVY
jgi:hypothetical protein